MLEVGDEVVVGVREEVQLLPGAQSLPQILKLLLRRGKACLLHR